MKRITTCETVDPGRLTGEERERLVHDLYAVQSRIFEGVDIQGFAGYILRPEASRTRVRIFRDEERQPVGYHAFHLFEIEGRGGGVTGIFRAEAGLLHAYRRKHATLSLSFVEYVRYKCLHPRRKAYYLGTLVHPSSYHLIFRHCLDLFPSHRSEVPPDVAAFMVDTARALGIAPASRVDPLIVKVGWRVRNDKEEMAFWSGCGKPDVRYFLKRNPGYREGEGLLTLVPVTWKNLAWLLLRWATESRRRWLRRAALEKKARRGRR